MVYILFQKSYKNEIFLAKLILKESARNGFRYHFFSENK